MAISRPCDRCGQPCPPQPHQGRPRRWCSRACSDKAKRMHRCASCGREFSGTAECCLPCRRRTTAARRAERKAAKPRRRTWTPADIECPICRMVFTQEAHNQVYCSPSCRESRRGWSYATKAATAEERGYGKAHRIERAKWKPIVESGRATCCICGYSIEPGSKWHLDHTPERDGYRGVAHAACNIRDGARRGGRRGNADRSPITKVCITCHRGFTTIYAKQCYCSAKCRPKRKAKPKTPAPPRACVDCGVSITRRKRCERCAVAWGRTVARNAYRQRVGIPADAPLWSRALAS